MKFLNKERQNIMSIKNDQPTYPFKEEPEGSYQQVGTFILIKHNGDIMSSKISKIELEDKILQLIYRAEAFLKWAENIRIFYNKNKPRKLVEKQKYINNDLVKYLILQHNLYFSEAVLNLNTLLKLTRGVLRSKELSFEYYFYKNSNKSEFEKGVDKIREKYKKSNLDKVRDKIIAHKDIKNIGDPITHFMNLISNKLFNSAKSILEDLEQISLGNFKDPICNNYFESYFTKGQKIVLDMVKKKIKENYEQKPTKN